MSCAYQLCLLPWTAAERAAEAARQAAEAADAARAAAHVDTVLRVPLWAHAVVCAASVVFTLGAAAWVAYRLYTLEKEHSEVSYMTLLLLVAGSDFKCLHEGQTFCLQAAAAGINTCKSASDSWLHGSVCPRGRAFHGACCCCGLSQAVP